MTMANATLAASARQQLDQRLDLLEQALIGILPRQERAAVVAGLEARMLELVAGASGVAGESCLGPAVAIASPLSTATRSLGSSSGAPSRKRSKLALASGISGIGAIGLMLALPVSYFVIMMFGEILGEVLAISLLGGMGVGTCLAGLCAITLGTVALVRLRRRQLGGQAWAVTGLCAGPVPALAGALATLVLLAEVGFLQSSTEPSVPVVGGPQSFMLPPELQPSNAVPSYVAPAAASSPAEYRPSAPTGAYGEPGPLRAAAAQPLPTYSVSPAATLQPTDSGLLLDSPAAAAAPAVAPLATAPHSPDLLPIPVPHPAPPATPQVDAADEGVVEPDSHPEAAPNPL